MDYWKNTGNTVSTKETVKTGVLQCPALGPVLVVLYMIRLLLPIDKCKQLPDIDVLALEYDSTL